MDPAPVADRTEPSAPAESAGAQCPFPHGQTAAPAPVAPADEATCPFPFGQTVASGCPVPHGQTGVTRTRADLVVRRILRIPDRPAGRSSASAHRAFQKSMLISATRCTLTYVVFPFLLPFVHILRGGAPVIGVLVGSVALVSDTFTIRRFFAVDHKWRWYFSGLAFSVMCLLSVLLVQDIGDLVSHFT